MNGLMRWIINIAVIYALVVGVMLLARRPLIYPFDTREAFLKDLTDVQIHELERPDGSKLVVWATEPAAKQPVIFYFMGNIGNLEQVNTQFRPFLEEGFGLVAMAYRGGGGVDGRPSELALTEDAKFLWDNLEGALRIRIPENQRYIYGFSLGAGIATSLASQTQPAGLILEAPFTRLCAVAQWRFKIVPACRLMWDEFYPVIDQIKDIDAPFLVLHGSDDDQIPVSMGEAIFRASPQNGTLKIYPGGRHNDLRLHGADKDAISFINAVHHKEN